MRMRFASTVFAALVAATPAVPCAFHGYTPQATVVEKLLGSEHVVLARTSPETCWSFLIMGST